MDQDTLIIWGIGLGLTLVTVLPIWLRLRGKERQTESLRSRRSSTASTSLLHSIL
jgi:cytochrome c-type biogenesis protein CcmH/NrfF